jgi:hypothetical protein
MEACCICGAFDRVLYQAKERTVFAGGKSLRIVEPGMYIFHLVEHSVQKSMADYSPINSYNISSRTGCITVQQD